jgi:hypothetical protein
LADPKRDYLGLNIGAILADRFGEDFVKKLVIFGIIGVIALLILGFLIVFLAVLAGNAASK